MELSPAFISQKCKLSTNGSVLALFLCTQTYMSWDGLVPHSRTNTYVPTFDQFSIVQIVLKTTPSVKL